MHVMAFEQPLEELIPIARYPAFGTVENFLVNGVCQTVVLVLVIIGKIADDEIWRMLVHDAFELRDRVRPHAIVCVDKPDILAVADIKHSISREAEAAIGLIVQKLERSARK